MNLTESKRQLNLVTPEPSSTGLSEATWTTIETAFGLPAAILDVELGEAVYHGEGFPPFDIADHLPACREVARRGTPEMIDERDPLWLLALPIHGTGDSRHVAVLALIGRTIDQNDDLERPAQMFGYTSGQATAWAARQPVWSPDAALRMAAMALAQIRSDQRVHRLETEVGQLSSNINSTYEEISLLHRLTENLRLSQSDEAFARIALEWLEEVVPAECIAIHLTPAGQSKLMGMGDSPSQVFLALGHCPISGDEFLQLAQTEWEKHAPSSQPLVLNRAAMEADARPFPTVREAIFAPLAEGNHRFGWIGAINHAAGGEFGSAEASLLSSVAAILGIHSGNILLYQQQAELTAGIIRALTEAIDAKDQYTCGHSDRVARIAVRLAQEMKCDLPTINTIYLAGLLHDVGKIGIVDDVLRKPGKLTPEEYEHIKTHPLIGHRILRDIKKLDHILPAILHHHESWNGTGYPKQLVAESIPLTARIVAVADSYDAMGSDRPYRKGLPREKIEQIFRNESGVQWDPQVVAAFFRAEADLRRIVNDQRRELALDFSVRRD